MLNAISAGSFPLYRPRQAVLHVWVYTEMHIAAHGFAPHLLLVTTADLQHRLACRETLHVHAFCLSCYTCLSPMHVQACLNVPTSTAQHSQLKVASLAPCDVITALFYHRGG